MKEPLDVKLLGNDLIQVDGITMSLQVIKSAMNPNELAQRTLFSVKRVGDELQVTSYYDATASRQFFEQFIKT